MGTVGSVAPLTHGVCNTSRGVPRLLELRHNFDPVLTKGNNKIQDEQAVCEILQPPAAEEHRFLPRPQCLSHEPFTVKGTVMSIPNLHASSFACSPLVPTHPLDPAVSPQAGGGRIGVRAAGSHVPCSGGAGAASEPRRGARGCVQAGLYIQSGRGCACSHAGELSQEQEP